MNEPNTLGDVSYAKPGKYIGIWWAMHINDRTWASNKYHGATTAEAKRYIDFAAKHGFAGVLVEGWNKGWDGDWFNNGDVFSFTEAYPDYDIAEVSRYANAKGVNLIVHHETSANLTNYENQLDAGLDLVKQVGAHYVKTGYVSDAGDAVWTDA
ncbi:glycoside hydrolase family 97 catalytic domain-containing protein, partial [Arcanobacterium phocae]|uniref:glycoside hydrolase family 97 catalytic domain-containing protein n=1 Tax=Arcanobacterium phocae TaxID=131112 RepID=UPI001C108A73